MSKFFQVPGEEAASDGLSSDEESLYGSSMSEDLSSGSEDSDGTSESDSEADSESDSDSNVDGAGNEDQPRNQYLRNQFLKGGHGDSDEDSEDERIVVKSAKDKVLDEVLNNAQSVQEALTKKDWISALANFDKLVKIQEKANKQYSTVPKESVQTFAILEDVLSDRASTKDLSPSQAKSQNTLRQRLKKAAREYTQRIESYRKDPDTYEPGLPSILQTSTAQGKPKASAPGVQTPAADSELSSATVFRTLISVVESRGRKNTDKAEQASLLERQFALAETAYQKISVLLMLIPLRFDLSTSNVTSSQGSYSSLYAGADFEPWEQIESDLRKLFEILESQSEYVIIESAPEAEDLEAGPQPGAGGKRQIPGSLPTLVERLDDEHARILATYDPHTTEYIERLRDETKLADLIMRAQCHQESTLSALGIKPTDSESYCRLLGRRIDHIYYKPSVSIAATEVAAWSRVPSQLNTNVGQRVTDPKEVNPIALISQLCEVLYKQSNTLLRARAVLSLMYQYALSDDYYKARDLMLMSHLQSQIHVAEPATQVLFNRSLVQVGLCAFRSGLISDALQSLQEICGSSRLKELLGQGQARQQQAQAANDSLVSNSVNAPELLPYHMHINLELVECVYLTSSMLTEVPYLANIADMRSAQLDLKRRVVNRPFRRLLDVHDRQVFSGPSETTRDYVIQAAKCLQTGDWRGAHELLSQIKVWSLVSPLPDARSKILTMLEHKLKVEGLRTYLLTYGAQAYHSVSLKFLESEFQLSPADSRQLLVKMISGDEIAALLDPTSNYVVFRPEADVSRLQTLALALADKAAQLAERNERLAADGHIPEQVSKRPVRARN